MGATSRKRGVDFERWTAARLTAVYPRARRQQDQDMDQRGYDLTGAGPFAIQCKRGRGYAPVTALFEVQPESDHVPLLVTKADKRPAVAVLLFDDLLVLASSAAVPAVEHLAVDDLCSIVESAEFNHGKTTAALFRSWPRKAASAVALLAAGHDARKTPEPFCYILPLLAPRTLAKLADYGRDRWRSDG